VSTEDIKERIKQSLKPIGGSDEFNTTIVDNPDLYGPFWIMATWTILLSICGIAHDYLKVLPINLIE